MIRSAPTLVASRASLDVPPRDSAALPPVQACAGRLGAADVGPLEANFPCCGPAEDGEPPTVSPNGGFHWPVRVYWEDTDAGGIVFYANYLKFFERSRTEWLRSLGIEQQRLKDSTGGMFVVLDTAIRYLRPARLDDELIVTASMVETGRASMIIKQQALLKTEQNSIQSTALLCEGTIRIGWVDAATVKPCRIPASILDSLRTSP